MDTFEICPSCEWCSTRHCAVVQLCSRNLHISNKLFVDTKIGSSQEVLSELAQLKAQWTYNLEIECSDIAWVELFIFK